eukprot:2741776-Rhodomonas_salina.2
MVLRRAGRSVYVHGAAAWYRRSALCYAPTRSFFTPVPALGCAHRDTCVSTSKAARLWVPEPSPKLRTDEAEHLHPAAQIRTRSYAHTKQRIHTPSSARKLQTELRAGARAQAPAEQLRRRSSSSGRAAAGMASQVSR